MKPSTAHDQLCGSLREAEHEQGQDLTRHGHAEEHPHAGGKPGDVGGRGLHARDTVRCGEFGDQRGRDRGADGAGELLHGVGIPTEQHNGPMREVAPGWKLRVLLAQALFANPDILLLDEPTNNLDINTIRWLENTLNQRNSTMIIISHDRHFLNSVCTHMADVDYGEIRIYPGNYDDYMLASAQARERLLSSNAKAKERIGELQDFVARFSANKSKARQEIGRAHV